MRILISSIIDVTRSAPNRLHHFIVYLAAKHEITVVCISDWWKAEQVNTNEHYQDFRGALASIKVNYITTRKISPIAQELFSPLLMKVPGNDFDIIFNYNTLIAGYYLARKFKLPMVYDLADDLPGMIAGSPQIPGLLRLPGKWWGEFVLRRSMAISTKVTGISTSLRDKYSVNEKTFELVPNGVDTQLFRKRQTDLKKKLGLEDCFVLGYVGVLREWVDFEPAYRALRSFDKVRLLLVGEEGRMKENKDLVRRYGVEDKVIYTGTVPYEEVPAYISAMDVCLIPFKQNAVSNGAVPLKLFEYMACEKPVICTPLTGVKLAVSSRVLYATGTEELKNRIAELFANKELCLSLGIEGRTYVNGNYTWAKICAKLEDILIETAGRERDW